MLYIGLAAAPVIIILTYIYVRDKFNREPFWLLFLCLLGGMFSVIPVLLVGAFTDIFIPFTQGIGTPIYTAFIQAGFVEEMFKYLVVLIIIWCSKHFDERFDGIVYAVFVSMGFALVENLLYVAGEGVYTGVMRFFTAVPAHAIFGIAMGYYLGLAKFNPWRRSTYMALAFIVPWLLHGFYDAVLMVGYDWLLLVFIVYLVWMYIFGFKKIKKLAKLKINPKTIVEVTATDVLVMETSDVIIMNRETPKKIDRNGTKE